MIDPNNKESLLNFFNRYNHLKNHELAVLANRSTSTIREWKRKCGLSVGGKQLYPRVIFKKLVPTPPDNWDNKEWFYDMYVNKKYGTGILAQILGLARSTIWKKLRKYNIKLRSNIDSKRSKNKYCNEEWLRKYYEEYGWSTGNCAEAAGVQSATIYDWLIRFKIKVRDDVPHQGDLTRGLINKQKFLSDIELLKNNEIVENIKSNSKFLKVKFKSGLSEYYNKAKLAEQDRFKKDVVIGTQYPVYPNSSDELKKLFRIDKKDLKKSGRLDVDICIHKLIKKLCDEKFSLPQYPNEVLINEYKEIAFQPYLDGNQLLLYPRKVSRYIGRCLQEHFYDFTNDRNRYGRSIADGWNDPKHLCFCLKTLIKLNNEISKTSIIRKFPKLHLNHASGRYFRSPGLYYALFKLLNLEYKWIHDKTPFGWAKAIAASKCNSKYTYSDANLITKANEYNNFLESINQIGNTSFVNDDEVVADTLILDNNLEGKLDIAPYIDRLGKNWKSIIVTSNNNDYDIKISAGLYIRDDIFLKIYK